MIEKIDNKHISERVAFGKAEEDKIIWCMAEHGFTLEKSSHKEDCKDKIDAWHVAKNGKRNKCAIKVRKGDKEKNDILIAVRDPWYGEEDERTKIGRDVITEYAFYITRNPEKTKIRVTNGKVISKIVNDMLAELKISNWNLNEKNNVMVSSNYQGCQLRYHRDAWKGHPKILGFINPIYLKEGKEIVFYDYFEKK